MSTALTSSGRRLSGLERVWLAADRIQSPFVNQLVLEGRGTIAAGALKEAVAAAAAVHPGMSLRLRGWLRWSRWKPGPSPTFRVVDGRRWDGMGPKGAPFLDEPLNPYSGPVAEVLWVEGEVPRMVIRSHHAVTDGRGATLFAEDLFRALRGEALLGAACGPLTDADLAEQVRARPVEKKGRPTATKEVEAQPPADRPAPTGKAHIFTNATTWARQRVPGHFSQLLPRVMRAVAGYARAQSEIPLRVDIAVDLRRFLPELRSSANLTGILHLDLTNLPSGPDAIPALESQILAALPRAALVPLHAENLRNVPLTLMARAGRKSAVQNLRKGRYPISATFSNLGWQNLRNWSGGGFSAQRAFWIPPGNPGLPLFLTLTGDDEGIELCAAMPVGLADEGRLEGLLADLRADLLVDSLRSLRRK